MHIIIFRGRKQNEGDQENLKKSLDEERRKAEVCSCAHFDLTFLLKKSSLLLVWYLSKE